MTERMYTAYSVQYSPNGVPWRTSPQSRQSVQGPWGQHVCMTQNFSQLVKDNKKRRRRGANTAGRSHYTYLLVDVPSSGTVSILEVKGGRFGDIHHVRDHGDQEADEGAQNPALSAVE